MIVPRYLLARLGGPFAFGLALFSGVLLLDKIFDLINLLVNKGVPFRSSLEIFALFLPTILSLSAPMAILLACLIGFGRLSEETEITALRAGGLSGWQIFWPPLAGALLLSAALIPFNTVATPRSMAAFRRTFHRIASADPLIQIEPRQFLAVRNFRIYAHAVSPDRKTLGRVWLVQFEKDGGQRIYAETGRAETDERRMVLRLFDGQIHRFDWARPGDGIQVRFEEYTLTLPFTAAENTRSRGWREMSQADLRREAASRRALGLPTGPVEAERHLRWAMAFAPLAFALVGTPLGVSLERGGGGVGFGAALGVMFAYYLFLMLGLSLAEKGTWPAGPALWLANTVTAGVAAVLIRRKFGR
jgi:LPS export ABC transporter permease LptF